MLLPVNLITMEIRRFAFSMFVFALSSATFCQEVPADTILTVTVGDSSGLFHEDRIFEISLKFDLNEYKRNRAEENNLKAELSYLSGSDTVILDLKVRPRGEFRRKFCDMPPIMLNFKNDSTGEFANIDKLKMVTQCLTGNRDLLLREYLVYKLYNEITDVSYRVRLLRVNYINTARNNRISSEYAFVIEPDEHLAKRINAVEVRTDNLNQKLMKPDMLDRLAIFNYMIGNSDWSVPLGHNIKMFAQPYSERPDLAAVVPYDFDFCGLVNAEYPAPSPRLGIESVRERVYLGICRDRATFLKGLSEFLVKKDALYKVINEFTLLERNSRVEIIAYMEGFFEELSRPDNLVRTLLRECIKF